MSFHVTCMSQIGPKQEISDDQTDGRTDERTDYNRAPTERGTNYLIQLYQQYCVELFPLHYCSQHSVLLFSRGRAQNVDVGGMLCSRLPYCYMYTFLSSVNFTCRLNKTIKNFLLYKIYQYILVIHVKPLIIHQQKQSIQNYMYKFQTINQD